MSADGATSGEGRLVGVLMNDFQLGEPFDLGSYGTFKAPAEGNLYLRCQDPWGELADNKGAITVKLKQAGRGTPLARSKGETPSVLGEASPATHPGAKAEPPLPKPGPTSVLGQASPATTPPPKPGPIAPLPPRPEGKAELPRPSDAAPQDNPWPPQIKRPVPLPGPPAPS